MVGAPASRVLLPSSNSNTSLPPTSPALNGKAFTKSGVNSAANETTKSGIAQATPSPAAKVKAAVAAGNASRVAVTQAGMPSPDPNHAQDAESKNSWRSWKRGEGLQPWEMDLLNKPEVKRKANVAQMFFLNNYFESLRYLSNRRARTSAFKSGHPGALDVSSSTEAASYLGRERALLRKRRTKLRLDSFHIIAQVGQGGYGEVFLARKKDTGQVCALKRLRKRVLVKMDEVRHVLTERDILTATNTPWLVRLLYAFQNQEHVFLAMEYVPGGDFRTLLNNSGVLQLECARFYMSEMFVACNELHKLGYIHRDLKPENFLVDATGHIKLTDFGLAAGAINPGKLDSMRGRLDAVKDVDLVYRTPHERSSLYKQMRAQNVQHADSIVGSPDYMAPEVLRGKEYGVGVDYWSLGCILFEFRCSFPPFSGGSPDETWANLKNWQQCLRRPVYTKPQDLQFNLNDVEWSVMTSLIAGPKDRLNTLAAVQAHPFFAPLDFTKLREVNPPFLPQLEGETDTGYFDDFNEGSEDMAKYKEVFEKAKNVDAVKEGSAGGRGMWAGFTFGKNVNAPPNEAFFDKDATDVFATLI